MNSWQTGARSASTTAINISSASSSGASTTAAGTSSPLVDQHHASPDTRRVLVIGDNASGKSLLVSLLCSSALSASGMPQLPTTRLPPTLGCRVDAMLWSREGKRCIEFVEVGGGRSMMPAARASCYGNVDGVILVFHQKNPSSVLSLHQWYEELRAAGVIGGRPSGSSTAAYLQSNAVTAPFGSRSGSGSASPKPFLLIGTQLPKSSRTYAGNVDGFLDAVANPASFASGAEASSAKALRLIGQLMQVVVIWQRLLLLAMSFVLFGLNQSVVPVRVPSVKKALETIQNDEGCHATIENCPLDSGVNFANNAEDIRHFLASLW